MTEWHSDFTGSFHSYLSPGCKICQQGASLVLFVTGICDRDCFYCPLSEERRDRDVVFADEREASSVEDVLEEARAIGALGTGITGGEPLKKQSFVVECIRALKREFGEEHHVHLYTGANVGVATLKRLKTAGLDEIRFHPPLTSWIDPRRLAATLTEAKRLGLEAGVEIPALRPVPEIVAAVMKTDAFLNLNELEFSETNQRALKDLGLYSKASNCGAVGSEEIAREDFMIEGLKVHYCSSRFKDSVQLRERLKRRAERVSRPFDIPTDDGTLIVGVMVPVDGDLGPLLQALRDMEVPQEMYALLEGRVEIAGWILEDISELLRDFGCDLALEERYPIEDGPVVERIPL